MTIRFATTPRTDVVGREPRHRGRRVLIVDDDSDFRQSLGVLLRHDGHEVRCAYDGLHALREAAAWAPDLVLLDIYMPGPSGFVTARRLRADWPGKRMVLVMTSAGDLDEVTLATAGEAGFDRCVDKTNALTDVRAILADHFPPSAVEET